MIELSFVFLLFVMARAGGWLAQRVGAEMAMGEILAGVALASAVPFLPDGLSVVTVFSGNGLLEHAIVLSIGVLMLLAGIELKPEVLAKQLTSGLSVALAGAVVPFAAGVMLAWTFLPEGASRLSLSLMTGLALSITAIPATIKILEEFKLLTSAMGATIITAALLDDVIGLVLMAVVIAIAVSGVAPTLMEIVWLLAKVAAFFAVAIGLGNHVFPHLRRTLHAVDAAAVELSVLIFVAFLYAMLAEFLGLHWILGPFMAGLFFEPARVGAKAYLETKASMSVISSAALGPLFFASIGLHVDLLAVSAAPLFLVGLIAVALLGKVIGAGGAAKLVGFSSRDATAIGIGMSARGAVEIVVLNIALTAGVFTYDSGNPISDNLFSLLVIAAVATTAMAPPLLRLVLRRG